ncbi:MAG: hypothetical protein WKG07_08085 [Hymenobacter sp.]
MVEEARKLAAELVIGQHALVHVALLGHAGWQGPAELIIRQVKTAQLAQLPEGSRQLPDQVVACQEEARHVARVDPDARPAGGLGQRGIGPGRGVAGQLVWVVHWLPPVAT